MIMTRTGRRGLRVCGMIEGRKFSILKSPFL
jgi:hypothetical protein